MVRVVVLAVAVVVVVRNQVALMAVPVVVAKLPVRSLRWP